MTLFNLDDPALITGRELQRLADVKAISTLPSLGMQVGDFNEVYKQLEEKDNAFIYFGITENEVFLSLQFTREEEDTDDNIYLYMHTEKKCIDCYYIRNYYTYIDWDLQNKIDKLLDKLNGYTTIEEKVKCIKDLFFTIQPQMKNNDKLFKKVKRLQLKNKI